MTWFTERKTVEKSLDELFWEIISASYTHVELAAVILAAKKLCIDAGVL